MKLKVNRVIRLLVVSDFMLYFAIGLFSPIFAIFVLENVDGSTLQVVGLATTIHWLARILTTIPFSRFMDNTKGEKDEFYLMIAGTLAISVLTLFYLKASLPWHIYLIQFLTGVAGSMASPSWRILFTNHLDRGETGYEWALEDVAAGIAVALSAYAGSYVAQNYGFEYVIYSLTILGFIGTIILLPLYKDTVGIRRKRRLYTRHKTVHRLRKKHVRVGVRGV